VSRIRSLALKVQVPRSLSPHLAIFRPYALSRSSVSLDTVMPPPHAVLDPGPEHTAASSLASEHAIASTPTLEHVAAVLFLKP
jgi:hypothetical protein